MHCRPSELLNERALDLDWILAIDDTVAKARRNLERKEMDRAR